MKTTEKGSVICNHKCMQYDNRQSGKKREKQTRVVVKKTRLLENETQFIWYLSTMMKWATFNPVGYDMLDQETVR